MSKHASKRSAEPQPAAAGAPPKPPKRTAKGSQEPAPEGTPLFIPDPVVVSDLAATLKTKGFKIVADLMEIECYRSLDGLVDFETASKVIRKYGHEPIKLR